MSEFMNAMRKFQVNQGALDWIIPLPSFIVESLPPIVMAFGNRVFVKLLGLDEGGALGMGLVPLSEEKETPNLSPSYEDLLRRWPSASQEENSTMMAPWS